MSQRKNSGRSTGKETAATTTTNDLHQELAALQAAATTRLLSLEETARIAELSNFLAVQSHASLTAPKAALGPLSAVTASPADITDELAKGGPAFGAFVKSVGLGVADAQSALDQNLVTTAQALSNTNIDVISVVQQVIDPTDGSLQSLNIIKEKLPLINFLPPVSYQWTRVFLQADMKVSEFNSANGFNVQGKSKSFSAGISGSYGTGGFGISGGLRYGSSSYSASGESSYSQDVAAGSMHMEATLEPRPDMVIPPPFVLQKGPRLRAMPSGIINIGTSPNYTGRKVVITLELLNGSTGLAGKTLEFHTSDPMVTYKTWQAYDFNTNTGSTTSTATNSTGILYLEVIRDGAAFDPAKAPTQVVIRSWFGLVAAESAIVV